MNETMANPVVDAVDEVREAEWREHVLEMREQQDQPVAVVQEFIEPDDQPITDHTTVAETLSAGVVYPNLPPTVDEFRDTVTEIGTNNIPDGVTAAQVVETYQNTGVVMGVDPLPAREVVEDHPMAVEITENEKFKEQLNKEEVERKTKFDKEFQEAQLSYEKKMEEKREEIRRRLIRDKRKEVNYHTRYFLNSNDMMFIQSTSGRVTMIKNDTQKIDTIQNLEDVRTGSDEKFGDRASYLNNGIIFDKNMNPLTANYSPFGEKSDKRFKRFDIRETGLGYNTIVTKSERWIIVDKEAFMKSKGKDFRIKNRIGYTIQEALQLKQKVVKKIEKVDSFVKYLKDHVGEIYNEENYEIIYYHNMSSGSPVGKFYIYLQFPELVVTNSIEMTRVADNLITRMEGKHSLLTDNNLMHINAGLYGLRTKFTPEDAFYGWNHSHLPSSADGWEGFCMGDNHFMSTLSSNTTELEFEMLLFGVLDHISWESLEGGPYIKMESIGDGSNDVVTPNNTRILDSYGKSAMTAITNYLKRENLDSLKDAFVLKTQKNKEVTYELNKRVFFDKITKLFDKDFIYNVNSEYEYSGYAYIPSDGEFRLNDAIQESASSWNQLVKDGRQNVLSLPITYMNGGYVRPQLIKTENPGKIVKKSTPSFNPTILLQFAKIIHYHLLNELKNVKK